MRFTFVVVLSLCCFPVFSQTDWQKQKEEDGIQVFTKKVEGSKYKAFRGVGEIDTPLSAIIAVFMDINSFTEWSHAAVEARTVKLMAANECVNYILTDAPWPVSDREGVYHFKIEQNKEDKSVMVSIKAVEGYVSEHPKRIRVPFSEGYWKLIPLGKDKTKVIYENHAEPGGTIPAWLANSSVINLPFKTIKKLQKHAKKPKYQKQKFSFIEE